MTHSRTNMPLAMKKISTTAEEDKKEAHDGLRWHYWWFHSRLVMLLFEGDGFNTEPHVQQEEGVSITIAE